MNITCKL